MRACLTIRWVFNKTDFLRSLWYVCTQITYPHFNLFASLSTLASIWRIIMSGVIQYQMKQHVWNFLTACIQTTLNLFPGKPVGGKLWGFRKPKFFECQEMLHSKEIDATKILLHKNALNGNHLNLSFYLSIKRVETLLVSNCCQDVDILACVITQISTKLSFYS